MDVIMEYFTERHGIYLVDAELSENDARERAIDDTIARFGRRDASIALSGTVDI